MSNDRPGIPNEQNEPIMDGAMDHDTSPSDAYTDGMTMAEAEDRDAETKQAEKDDADSPDELEQADETIELGELP